MPLTLARLAATGGNRSRLAGVRQHPGRLALLGAGIHTVIVPAGRPLASREDVVTIWVSANVGAGRPSTA